MAKGNMEGKLESGRGIGEEAKGKKRLRSEG